MHVDSERTPKWAAAIDHTSLGITLFGGGLLGICAFTIVYNAISRKFGGGVFWVYDTSIYILLIITFLGMARGFRDRVHIHVDIITRLFSERTQAYLRILGYIACFVFLLVLGYEGAQKSIDFHRVGSEPITLLPVKYWILYLLIPLGSLLACLQLIRETYTEVVAILSGKLESHKHRIDHPLIALGSIILLLCLGVLILTQVNDLAGLLVLVLVFLFAGVPVAFALGCAGIAGFFFLLGGESTLVVVPLVAYNTTHNFILIAAPMFILAGILLSKGQMGDKIFILADKWMSGFPASVAVATILTCGVLAAMIGTSVAIAAAMGLVAIPAMISRKYKPSLACGAVAAGGTLGILIPPSAGMIIYGSMTDTSVGRLFMAGLIPGVILMGMYSIYVVFSHSMTMRRGTALGVWEEEPKITISWREKWMALWKAIPMLFAPLLVLGGIYGGYFTPTEAGALLVVYVAMVGIINRNVHWQDLVSALKQATSFTSMLLMIMIGALLLGQLFGHLRLPQTIAEAITSADLSKWQVIACITLLYLVLGMFLEGLSIIMLTLPVFFPVLPVLGIDPYWFAVYLMMMVELCLITPPVGMNIFMVKGVSGEDFGTVVRGVIPFWLLLIVGVVLIYIFPGLVTWLPDLM